MYVSIDAYKNDLIHGRKQVYIKGRIDYLDEFKAHKYEFLYAHGSVSGGFGNNASAAGIDSKITDSDPGNPSKYFWWKRFFC
jgi:hypothetical protein